MSKPEVLSAEGLRADGRRANELRCMKCEMGTLKPADGSAFFQQGITQVLVSVYGPREVTAKSQLRHDHAILNVEFNISPFSSIDRRRRGKTDKRLLEYAHSIKSTFESSLFLNLYPRSQIDINIQVLQQDGALLATACNATTLALINAGIPLSNYVATVSVAAVEIVSSSQVKSNTVESHVILDLTSQEENDLAWVTIGALLPGEVASDGIKKEENASIPNDNMDIDNDISLVQGEAKFCLLQSETKMNLKSFEKCLSVGLTGCKEMFSFMDEQVRESSSEIVKRMVCVSNIIRNFQAHQMDT